MKLNICYFGDGESIHTRRWCEHFASLGHEVHLISFKNTTIDNVQVWFVNAGDISVKGGNWKVLLKYREVKNILNKIKPDVFHAHYATSYGITGALCNYHPYIISGWGSDVLIAPFQSKITKWLLQYAYSKADWITVVADHMQKALEQLNVSKDKVSKITHGIDPAIFNSTNRFVSKEIFSIISTRSFEPVYNIPQVIEAFAIAKINCPNLFLHLVGSGSLKEGIVKLIKEKGLTASVKLYGKISQAEIAELLNQSHLFITMALSDGDVVSLAEAIACDTFCIASDIPANNMWIKSNKNGFLVPLNDVNFLAKKITEVYNNYYELVAQSAPLNKSIIEEKGIWGKNMKAVEEKYVQLVKNANLK